ncbi:hypothetical protein ACHHYP_08724 [Achlya hypogyna]|uniref:Uncharacterized protein n=1 Tax=Achlya hypogyna TaxID=1202772 RepID=A0A1V9ZK35_ACHHY|nr:hypothetical protein ACHHYP_08724 [Achlya hypogyna]
MAMAEAESCKYTYKPCPNPRSTKRNGKPHLLCEFHRAKANAIQKAYATKKRQSKLKAQATAMISPTASDDFWASMNLEDQWPIAFDGATDDDDVPLTAEDCAMIANMFFEDHTVVEL